MLGLYARIVFFLLLWSVETSTPWTEDSQITESLSNFISPNPNYEILTSSLIFDSMYDIPQFRAVEGLFFERTETHLFSMKMDIITLDKTKLESMIDKDNAKFIFTGGEGVLKMDFDFLWSSLFSEFLKSYGSGEVDLEAKSLRIEVEFQSKLNAEEVGYPICSAVLRLKEFGEEDIKLVTERNWIPRTKQGASAMRKAVLGPIRKSIENVYSEQIGISCTKEYRRHIDGLFPNIDLEFKNGVKVDLLYRVKHIQFLVEDGVVRYLASAGLGNHAHPNPQEHMDYTMSPTLSTRIQSPPKNIYGRMKSLTTGLYTSTRDRLGYGPKLYCIYFRQDLLDNIISKGVPNSLGKLIYNPETTKKFMNFPYISFNLGELAIEFPSLYNAGAAMDHKFEMVCEASALSQFGVTVKEKIMFEFPFLCKMNSVSDPGTVFAEVHLRYQLSSLLLQDPNGIFNLKLHGIQAFIDHTTPPTQLMQMLLKKMETVALSSELLIGNYPFGVNMKNNVKMKEFTDSYVSGIASLCSDKITLTDL